MHQVGLEPTTSPSMLLQGEKVTFKEWHFRSTRGLDLVRQQVPFIQAMSHSSSPEINLSNI